MIGAIIINPYRIPKESVYQAERMQEEFLKLGVKTDIIDDGYIRANISDGVLSSSLLSYDFAVYLDKDKYLSAVLDKLSLKLFNSHSAIRKCDDKGETYVELANNGVNIAKTMLGGLCYSKDCLIKESHVDTIIEKLGLPVVVKESFGSMGKGVYLAESKNELLQIIEQIKLKPHLFQEYLPYKKGVDVRVIVVGGKAVASMERINLQDFRSNVARGGSGRKIELSKNFKIMAEKCANVLGLDYCGVDLLYGKNGEPYVCEVNSNAFIGGIESATGVNVAKIYAEYIVSKIK